MPPIFMLKFIHLKIVLVCSIIFFSCSQNEESFVDVSGRTFKLSAEDYHYIGCNYWYGGYLYSDTLHNGKKRLHEELDFLQKRGITNLRVFISAEGDASYPYRVYPSLQEKPGIYNEDLLLGFDYFLQQAAQRNMKIVFVLGNNWEWSGGFGQYLEWAGKGPAPLPKTDNWDWDAYCKYIAQFYTSESCKAWYTDWIKKIITRVNTFNQIPYNEDKAIMAWELANEPRPMDRMAIDDYINWVSQTAALIKSLDSNHLITIGTEGVISTFYDEEIYTRIHSDKNIDYLTLHLWPKTWAWYNGNSEAAMSDTTLQKTKDYIVQHNKIAQQLNKPLVIEEFGLHRDSNSFSPKASTKNRDFYYEYVIRIGKENEISGYNFWGFAGLPENFNPNGFMQKGMAYSADPPQEEQGLYAVFQSDSSTWQVILRNSSIIKSAH